MLPPFGFHGARRGPDVWLALPQATPGELRECRDRFPKASIVAVDGGMQALRAARLRPDLWIGDGDSCTSPPPAGTETIELAVDKDAGDLEVALRTLSRRDVNAVHVCGLWGGRPDHAWINLEVLGRAASRFSGGLSASGEGSLWLFLAASGGASEAHVGVPAGTLFSLVALAAGTRLTLRGSRWPLDNDVLRRGSHGLSNEARGRGPLRLRLHSGRAAWVVPGDYV